MLFEHSIDVALTLFTKCRIAEQAYYMILTFFSAPVMLNCVHSQTLTA